MEDCPHHQLTVLAPKTNPRLKCRRCGLTIAEEELGGGPCPECLEGGERRTDFERVEVAVRTKTRLRCEACGLVLDAEPPRHSATS